MTTDTTDANEIETTVTTTDRSDDGTHWDAEARVAGAGHSVIYRVDKTDPDTAEWDVCYSDGETREKASRRRNVGRGTHTADTTEDAETYAEELAEADPELVIHDAVAHFRRNG